jgi:uncharacterized protein YabE (DUF348 family)
MMKTINRYKLPILIALAGVIVYLITLKPVFLHEEGKYLRIFTHASSEAIALRDAGVANSGGSQPLSLSSSFLAWGAVLEVPTGRWIEVIYHGTTREVSVSSSGSVSATILLRDAGILLAPEEWLFADDIPLQSLDAEISVPDRLEVRDLVPVLIQMDGKEKEYRIPGPTVGDAVWQAGIRLRLADVVSPPSETLLASSGSTPVEIEVLRARAIRIRADGKETSTYAAGKTVGEAVAQAGFALTNLDFTTPPESDQIPADGVIRVVRVHEEILSEQESIPFETEMQPAADLELDQQRTIQAGVRGILETSIRVRYEDGTEVSRTSEGQHVLVPPKTQILGYGTKIVIRTLDTHDGPIEYYRSVRVYATAYSPSRCAGCNGLGITYSGKRVQEGMIAMDILWYNVFHGLSVYVTSYGAATVEDVGVGVYDPYWVDLYYEDADYVNWNGWTMLYFRTPVPANVVWVLP